MTTEFNEKISEILDLHDDPCFSYGVSGTMVQCC